MAFSFAEPWSQLRRSASIIDALRDAEDPTTVTNASIENVWSLYTSDEIHALRDRLRQIADVLEFGSVEEAAKGKARRDLIATIDSIVPFGTGDLVADTILSVFNVEAKQ